MTDQENVKFTTVDDYINSFEDEHRKLLEKLRQIIRASAPEATEVISYNMPAFRKGGILVYFAAHRGHIGLYPGSRTAMAAFSEELSGFATSAGTIRFPLNQPLPADLIRRIVHFRLAENSARAAARSGKR